jgi:hypothetical protein
MSAQAWTEEQEEALNLEVLLSHCEDMAEMLDEVEALIRAYQRTSDSRLLTIALNVIGAEEEYE